MPIIYRLFIISSFFFFLNIFASTSATTSDLIVNSFYKNKTSSVKTVPVPEGLICAVCRKPADEKVSFQLFCDSVAHMKCINDYFRNNPQKADYASHGYQTPLSYFAFLGSIVNTKTIPDGMTCQQDRLKSLSENVSIRNFVPNEQFTLLAFNNLFRLKFPISSLVIADDNSFIKVIFGPSPFEFSIENGANINLIESQCVYNVLFLAARHGYLNVLKWLIDSGHANVNARNSKGSTVLHFAIEARIPAVIEYLLEKGAKPDIISNVYGLPLQRAVSFGDSENTEMLLKSGAKPNRLNSDGEDVIFTACTLAKPDCLRHLLDHGATNNFGYYSEGLSCVHSCIAHGHLENLKLLISRGFNFNNSAGVPQYCLDVAAFKGYASIVDFLIECGANIYVSIHPELYASLLKTNPSYAGYLLESDHAAVIAACSNHVEVMKVFLKHGLNPNTRIMGGKSTLLHVACTGHYVEMAILLIQHGADTNALVGTHKNIGVFSILSSQPELLAKIKNHDYLI